MRLIDADEIEELFREVISGIAKKPEMTGSLEHMIRASAMVIEMIQDAPTIEPERKTGHWIRTGRENVYGGYEVECSECGDTVMIMHIEDELYCRHCGAKMEEGEQE